MKKLQSILAIVVSAVILTSVAVTGAYADIKARLGKQKNILVAM